MFSTHNDEAIDINGTCLQGYMKAEYGDIVAAFGKPEYWGGPKVQWEWKVVFEDGEIATIYDWKNYWISKPEEVNEWHIGGHNPVVVKRIIDIIGG